MHCVCPEWSSVHLGANMRICCQRTNLGDGKFSSRLGSEACSKPQGGGREARSEVKGTAKGGTDGQEPLPTRLAVRLSFMSIVN